MHSEMRCTVQPVAASSMGVPRQTEGGTTLIELMIAMSILAIGLGALTTMLAIAITSNNRNSKDTSASLLAQMVIEQITAQHPNSNAPISVTDCTGNVFSVATTGGASPSGAGASLVTTSSSLNYGGIDPTQDSSTIPSGYTMHYVDCGGANNTGTPTTYDVRWNVMTIDANQTRLITASARPLAADSNLLGGHLFAMPVNLRAVGGP
jgi:prepilin-type N-terminal cleavage/methylation domain-containing protein